MKTIADDPIYPINTDGWNPTTNGLTKREQFAAMMMQGLLANPNICMLDPMCGQPTAYLIENQAVYFADSLIKELNKNETR